VGLIALKSFGSSGSVRFRTDAHIFFFFNQALMQTIYSWVHSLLLGLLAWLSLPAHSLVSIFTVSLFSATFLPLPAEPVVLGVIELRPDLFWQAIGVATLGNTLGGMLTWGMGRSVHVAINKLSPPTYAPPLTKAQRIRSTALIWLQRLGPRACFFAWVPFIGDPLCALAGWMRLPLLPCAFYMALGKGLRFWMYSASFVWLAS
jgi:membrane protein YqaA with SNARE-associated domain